MAIDRGIVTLMRSCFLWLDSGLSLTTADIILKHCGGGTVPKRLISPGWPVVMGSGEVRSTVGSGPVPYTLLARLSIGL